MGLKIRAWIKSLIFVKISKKINNENSKITTENSKLGQKIHKNLYCALYQFSTKAFFIQKKMFLIEITIQVSFTSCCTAKRKKVVAVFFFRRFFFSLAQLSYEYISLGFFAGFCFSCQLAFCVSLDFAAQLQSFFSEPRGQKQKHYFFFSCLFCFLLVIFFSFQYLVHYL